MTTEHELVDVSTIQEGRRLSDRRLVVAVGSVVLAAGDLVAKVLLEGRLSAGRSIDLGILEFRLAFNSGAAFNLGASLPASAVVASTGLVTLGLLIFTWRAASTAAGILLTGLTMISAGALGNLVDRIWDGRVTDYLHTQWWPTFNMADVFITVGAITVGLSYLRQDRKQSTGPNKAESA